MVNRMLCCLLLSYFMVSTAYATLMDVTVEGVHDGDTFTVVIPEHPKELQQIDIRILGIDAPEYPADSFESTGKLGRAQCKQEAVLAIKSKKYLEHLIRMNNKKVRLHLKGFDKFGGRILADVYIGNVNVANEMVSRNLARPYKGERKINTWCVED